MTGEAWVAFRARILAFEDFINTWRKKLKGRDKDIVFKYIATQLKKNYLMWPVLRKVTGELFEKEHWMLLFSKLKLPSDVTLATLTLQHFIDAQPEMMAQKKEINFLAARAQGEVTIRDAVQELRVWAEETEFSVIQHETTSRKTYLIKDWKDIFTKISDQLVKLLTHLLLLVHSTSVCFCSPWLGLSRSPLTSHPLLIKQIS